MTKVLTGSKLHSFQIILLTTFLVSFFFPGISHALTPIARWDVVPYQRVHNGETFNVGVIAFSKGGINRVEITVTGQGYSGKNPLVSNAMTYNSRTDVYEYWVGLKASDFATNGPITLQAVVYGDDGGRRNLESLPLVVNATGGLPQPKAWVSKTGSDSTGSVNNKSQPFLSVGAAVNAIQKTNGGKSDGGIIYLMSGTYNLGNGSPSTTNEWLTITRDPGATKENTIINASGTVKNTKLLKIDGVTVKSRGSSQYVFILGSPTNLWVNDSNLIGSGRWIVNTNPIHFNSDTGHYSTNNYIFDADYAFRRATLVRGVDMEQIGNDAFENTGFVVNCTLDDLSNGPNPSWHADAFQTHTSGVPPPNNRIVYNYKATNVHYEGIFMRSDAGLAANNAFVNVFIELREPADLNETNSYAFMASAINQSWDHLLFWHCTFLNGHSEVSGTLTNASFIGNIFYQFIDSKQTTKAGDPVITFAANGNSGNNEFLYNHFMYVYGETETCIKNSRFINNNWPCPQWYAKEPDSDAKGSATMGGDVVDMSNPTSSSYGAPLKNTVLVDRIPFQTVPADIYGNRRDANPDLGAIEVGVDTRNPPPPSISVPSGFQKI